MTAINSLCFLLIFLWAFSIAAGLAEVIEVPQATTPGPFLTTDKVLYFGNSSHGDSDLTSCGKKNYTYCEKYCEHCVDIALEDCYSIFLDYYYLPFVQSMTVLNSTERCIWSNVRSHYNIFTLGTEDSADCLQIPWPNSQVEHYFVDIHALFFKDCPTEALSDPPPGIVFALVMTPISLIPVMVILVVLKTKNGDGSS
ncbi:receptor activity-modifying protein 2 isoform X2 [Hypomesus transpacificus]|uniref:receptor activity-modifying protein 2 isoform X2 n=1 Tax=Hypomesus transpacificus TaxID=137520 RepID=UPI001F079451|nr:receptor activity-modifying protein 2 isoform X2 [Hypomesus transpacificus]